MSPTVTYVLDEWMSLYANSAALRTGIGFAHVAGLIAGGGTAIAADRATLAAIRAGAAEDSNGERVAHLQRLHRTHRTVVIGLAVVIISGLLLLAADLDLYLSSWVFWTKMGLMALLLANGGLLVRAGARALETQPSAWNTLRLASIASLTLWMLITLMGAALPNV